GPEHDRLLLLVVVLETQGVARVDVDDLAHVAVGLRPVQLVSPGFLYTCRFMHSNKTPNSQLPIPNSQLPTPNSQLPIPNSQFPIPNSHPYLAPRTPVRGATNSI